MVRFADCAGVEVADAGDEFVARHMSVAVQCKIRPGRHHGRRFMDKIKIKPTAFQCQGIGCQPARVAISPNRMQRRPKR